MTESKLFRYKTYVCMILIICSVVFSSCVVRHGNNSVDNNLAVSPKVIYTPSAEWSKDGMINTVTTVTENRGIAVKPFSETTEENEIKVKALYESKGKYVPQPIKMKYNFDDYYLSLKKLEKNEVIDQVIIWRDELGVKRIVVREGKRLYEVASISHKKIEYFPEGITISDNCKNIVECSKTLIYDEPIIDLWGYTTYDGEFFYYGKADYDGDVDIFGKQLLKEYELPFHDGDMVLNGIKDAWIIDNQTIVYSKDNSLYKVSGYNNHEKIFSGDVKSVSGAYTGLICHIVFSTVDGELYGFGANYKKIIDEYKNKKHNFTAATKINVPFNVKDVTVVKNGIYAVDFNNSLYYWGNLWNNHKELYIPASKPLAIAENVKKMIPGTDEVYCLDDYGTISTYRVGKSKNKNRESYIKIEKNHEVIDCEQYINSDFMIVDNVLVLNPDCLKLKDFMSYVYVDEDTDFFANWWISYGEYKLKQFYSATPVLVSDNVEDISGSRYFKEGKWYQFNKKGISDLFLAGKVDKMFSYSDEYFFLRNNKLYASSDKLRHFDYKKDSKNQTKKHVVMEENVTDVWANSENIAFVKDGKLYSYGMIEHLRWKGFKKGRLRNYPDDKLPNIVSYSGIDVNKINNIYFDKRSMYILMKSGKTFKITPEQKDGQEWYRKTCHISDDMYMKEKGIVSISQTDFYYPYFSWFKLKNDGTVMFWKTKEDSGKKKKTEYLTDINSYDWSTSAEQFYESHSFYVVKTNGDLYGWGRNHSREIAATKKNDIPFNEQVLIANNVKEIAIPDNPWYCQGNGLFYLTRDGELFFRGYRGCLY